MYKLFVFSTHKLLLRCSTLALCPGPARKYKTRLIITHGNYFTIIRFQHIAPRFKIKLERFLTFLSRLLHVWLWLNQVLTRSKGRGPFSAPDWSRRSRLNDMWELQPIKFERSARYQIDMKRERDCASAWERQREREIVLGRERETERARVCVRKAYQNVTATCCMLRKSVSKHTHTDTDKIL